MNTCVSCGSYCKDDEQVCNTCWNKEINKTKGRTGITMAIVLLIIALVFLAGLFFGLCEFAMWCITLCS